MNVRLTNGHVNHYCFSSEVFDTVTNSNGQVGSMHVKGHGYLSGSSKRKAALTFPNVEAIDVTIANLMILRAKMRLKQIECVS